MLDVGFINKDTTRYKVIVKVFIDVGTKAH